MLKPIVVVEDDPNDVELTLIALGAARLANEVIVLRDGVEVLDYLRCSGAYANREKGNPAVVLLDIKLPRMDGVEILQQIKGDQNLRMVPVVMVTGSREEPDVNRCYALGANAYIVKPVRFHEFVKAVQDVGCFWGVLNEPPIGSVKPRVGKEIQ